VAPDTPGYGCYHILPQLGALNEISVSVPSVKGDIKTEIRRDVMAKEIRMTVDSPANTVARIGVPKVCPDMQVSVKGNAVFQGEDEKYQYFSAQPGYTEFVGK